MVKLWTDVIHWKGYICLYIIFMNQSVLLDNLLFVYLLLLDVVPLTKSMYWASCTNILLVRVNKLELNYWEVGEVECKERQSWVVWRLGRPSKPQERLTTRIFRLRKEGQVMSYTGIHFRKFIINVHEKRSRSKKIENALCRYLKRNFTLCM